MRWSLVCLPPNVTREVIQAALSELNQIRITTLSFYIKRYIKCAFPFSAWLLLPSEHLEGLLDGMCKWLVGGVGVATAGGWWPRRGNDQHWFILDVLLSGWCRQNTSLHPIPSHYLLAITAVQRVSCRVINTSPRPHTASTSSSRRRLMTAKDRQCILSLVTAMPLSVRAHFTVAEERIHSGREASSTVFPPQTLHLKWYIKATCLKILHMIDVGNDSVFSVWKSWFFFSTVKVLKKRKCQSPETDKKDAADNHNRKMHSKASNTPSCEGDVSETMNQIHYLFSVVIQIY